MYKIKKQAIYSYPLGSVLAARKGAFRHKYRLFLYLLRFLLLCLLALIVARPLLIDSRSEVTVTGIDMVLALDLSASMSQRDSEDDSRTRIEIAKDEAVQFIEKRVNDAIGLVIFGNVAVSRCPITYDKKLLKEIVRQLDIGIIDYNGTMLSTALITALSRLKHSHAKSKIIIVLTDGQPSDGDMSPDTVIEVARHMGVKIYTIGIGYDQPRRVQHSIFGAVVMPATIDNTLLKKIAGQTSGQYFVAHNAGEMHAIYEAIDRLEKSEITAPLFSKQYELGFIGILIAISLVCSEIIISTFLWFGL